MHDLDHDQEYEYDYDAPRKATGAVLVFAVINMVLGGGGLMMNILVMLGTVALKAPTQPTVVLVHMAANMFVALMLFVSGILLYRLASSAKKFAIAVASCEMLVFLSGAILSFTVSLPILQHDFASQGFPNANAMALGVTIFGVVTGALFGLLYPMLLLYFITRENASRQFTGALRPEEVDSIFD